MIELNVMALNVFVNNVNDVIGVSSNVFGGEWWILAGGGVE